LKTLQIAEDAMTTTDIIFEVMGDLMRLLEF